MTDEYDTIEVALVRFIREWANEARKRLGNRPVNYENVPTGGSIERTVH